MSRAWMAAVSLEAIAEPAELFMNLAKAAFEGARMVTFLAAPKAVASWGKSPTKLVRFDKSGLLVNAAVRFIV